MAQDAASATDGKEAEGAQVIPDWAGAVVTTIEQGTFEVTNDITATVTP